MSDENKKVDNLTSSMNALTKQMEKMSAQQILQSKNIDSQKKDFEDILKSSKGLENSYEEQGNLLQKTSKYLGEIGTNLKNALSSTIKIGSTLSTIGSTMFAANIIRDMVDLDNKMTALSVRMGKGHAGIKELKDSVTDLQEEFGTSYENASMLVEELAKDKYVGNIKNAAAGIDLFSRATDVSSAAVLELTNNLSKSGGLGTNSINAIYASMVKTQQAVGISDKGMNSLVNTINDMTMNMVAFGKTDKEIKQMAVETTALVGAFEKVGISAAKTTQLVNQLTDPDRIEDNILLYSQLGVSMEDALSGNIDIGALDGQFKEMADRIVQMGPIAGSQFARSMGLSYKEVSRMAEVEAGAAEKQIAEAMTPEEQALETMKSLEKATEGIGKQFETGLNKIEGKIKKLPVALLIGAAVVLPLLIKKGREVIHKIFNKEEVQASVADAVVPAIENSIKKAGGIVKGQATKLTNIVEGNIGQWFDSTKFGSFFNGLDRRVDASMARLKKESFIDKFLGASRQNLIDEASAKIEELSAKSEQVYSGLSDAFDKYGISIKKIDLANQGSLSNAMGDKIKDNAERKSILALADSYVKLRKQVEVYENEKERVMTKEHVLNELAKEAEELQTRKNDLEAEANELANNRVEAESNIADINLEIAELMEKAEGSDSAQFKIAAEKKIKILEDEKRQLDKNVKAWKARSAAINGETEDIVAQQAENTAKKDSEKVKPEKHINALLKLWEGVGNKVSSAFKKTTLGENLAAAREKSGMKHLGGKNTAKVIAGTAFSGAAKGIGKAVGGIAKAAKGLLKNFGPMAIVASILGKFLSKIQEPLSAMIDQIADTISPVIEQMLPAIEILMNVVAKHILPPILQLLSGMLNVANVILHYTLFPILKLLSHIPFLKGAMDGMVEALDAATGPAVSNALLGAASTLEKNGVSMKDSSEKMADSAEKMSGEDGPVVLSATGTSLIANGYTDPATQANERMTSTTVHSNSGSNKTIDDYHREKEEKVKSERLENIQNNSGVLPKIASLLEELLEFFTNKNVDIYWEDPQTISIGNAKPE